MAMASCVDMCNKKNCIANLSSGVLGKECVNYCSGSCSVDAILSATEKNEKYHVTPDILLNSFSSSCEMISTETNTYRFQCTCKDGSIDYFVFDNESRIVLKNLCVAVKSDDKHGIINQLLKSKEKMLIAMPAPLFEVYLVENMRHQNRKKSGIAEKMRTMNMLKPLVRSVPRADLLRAVKTSSDMSQIMRQIQSSRQSKMRSRLHLAKTTAQINSNVNSLNMLQTLNPNPPMNPSPDPVIDPPVPDSQSRFWEITSLLFVLVGVFTFFGYRRIKASKKND